jgi:regulatory protein
MQADKERALSKSMAICSKAEKCISDIQKKLDVWEIELEDAHAIIARLIEEKFIDEVRYTQFYVRDKFRFNNWGKVKIAFMLKGKGISNQLIEEALGQINEDDYLLKLTNLLQQKNKSVKAGDDYERKAKLTRFAQGRGFEYDVINTALRSF